MNVILNHTAVSLPHVLDIISGEDLLHNSNFDNPLNQRGQTSYSGNGIHTIDRWMIANNEGALSIADGAVSSFVSTYQYATLYQKIERYARIRGKTLTLSFLLENVESVNWLYAFDGVNQYEPLTYCAEGLNGLTFTVDANATCLYVGVQSRNGGSSFTPVRAKLEKGLISTLPNTPDEGEAITLLKCKRFYRVWTTEAARTEALKEVGLMRLASPTLGTIVIGGVTYYYASADL